MDNVFESNVLERSISTGAGAFALSAMPGFARFADVLSVGKTCHYMIKAVDTVGRPTGAWECGIGTYSAADTLTRTQVLGSSNANAAVPFDAGDKLVNFTALAPTTDALRFDWQEALGINLAGSVTFFCMSLAPAGWLKANGAAVSRTTYARLFARIGTAFGAGDGSTTFTLPDLRGEFLRALDDGRNVDTSRTLGSAQASQNLAHSHQVGSNGNGAYGAPYAGFVDGSLAGNSVASSSSGGTEARPRNVALLACIKY